MGIVDGNVHGNPSSNHGRGHFHSADTVGKGMNPIIFPQVMVK